MILITDIISSPVGHALLQLLLSQKEHEPVRVMVTPYDRLSHEDGFEPVVSSFYDLPSLDRALKGVNTLLISTFNLFTDCRCGYLNLLHEAVAEGVKRIIFISSAGRGDSVSLPMQENRETEMHIQQSGIPYAVFRVNILMENLPFFIGTEQGTGIYYPAGNGRVGFVSVHDVAEAILPFVTGRFGVENRAYTLSHEITYSFDDIAAKLSQYYSGRVKYESVYLAFYRKTLLRMDIPEDTVDRLCSVAKAISLNCYDLSDYTLKRLLGRHAEQEQLRQRIRRWFSQKESGPFLFGSQLTMLSDYLHGMYRHL